MCMNCRPLLTAIDAYLEKANNDLASALRKAGYAKPEKTVQTVDDIEDEIAEVLDEQTQDVVRAVNTAVSLGAFAGGMWAAWKRNDSTNTSIAQAFRNAFQKFMPEYAEIYIRANEGPLRLTQLTQRTLDWVESWSAQLGQIMRLSNHAELEKILAQGLREGNGISWYTQQILDAGIRDTRYKARRVALTEVLRAHSYARIEAMRQSPSVSGKIWRHSDSGAIKEPRPAHVVMDGTVVQGVDNPFTLVGENGIYECMCPRDVTLPPEESINCHCFMDSLIDESIHALPLEERARLQQEAVSQCDDEWLKQQQLEARRRYAPNPADWTEEAWQQAHDARAARGMKY